MPSLPPRQPTSRFPLIPLYIVLFIPYAYSNLSFAPPTHPPHPTPPFLHTQMPTRKGNGLLWRGGALFVSPSTSPSLALFACPSKHGIGRKRPLPQKPRPLISVTAAEEALWAIWTRAAHRRRRPERLPGTQHAAHEQAHTCGRGMLAPCYLGGACWRRATCEEYPRLPDCRAVLVGSVGEASL